MVEGRHDAATIVNSIEGLCAEWGVEGNEGAPIIVTADRGSNIRKGLDESDLFSHLACFQHVLHRVFVAAMCQLGSLAVIKKLT